MSRTLGPYQIHSELGRGAMAVVWRAYDPVLDRQVAIKEPVLPHGVDSTLAAEFGARFVREGRAAAKLNHPNIVTIHAADIYDGRAALVMELVEGHTLREVIDGGVLDSGLVLSVLEQLLSAVGYAHERGIVHRDIKPDNVFVTLEGRVKLADFGIASLASDSTLTQTGTIMGTPGYMAPEQVTGDPVDARADLFAVGVLDYEMLTGKNPFGAADGLPATTVMYRIVHQAPPEIPAEALAGLPANMRDVLGAALAKNPADRFPDAGSFLAALKGEGALPVPGAARASALPGVQLGQLGGTILARLSSIKSATIISRGPGKPPEPTWRRSWVPYAAVVGIGLIVMIALLVSAGGGGASVGEGGSASPVVATTADPGTRYLGDNALVLSVPWTDTSAVYKTYLEPWLNRILTESDGRVEFEIYPANALVKEEHQGNACREGISDLTFFRQSGDPSEIEGLHVLGTVFVSFSNGTEYVYTAAMNEDLWSGLPAVLQEAFERTIEADARVLVEL